MEIGLVVIVVIILLFIIPSVGTHNRGGYQPTRRVENPIPPCGVGSNVIDNPTVHINRVEVQKGIDNMRVKY